MTMSPARRFVFGIARRVLLLPSNVCKAVSSPINVWASWLVCPIRAFSHASNEYEAPGRFYIRPPSQINKLSIKGIGILRSDPHHLPHSENPSERVSERSIPAWPTSAAPPPALVAPSLAIGRGI